MSIKAIVTDAGGVLLQMKEYPQGLCTWEQRLHLKEGELGHHLWSTILAQEVITGKASPKELFAHISNMYGLNDENIALLESSMYGEEYVAHNYVNELRSLHTHYKTAVLSNAWPGSAEVLKHKFGLADVFDHFFISADIGHAKPTPESYRYAAQHLDIAPSEMLFIDDAPKNVEGAQALGIHAIHFQNEQQAIDDIRLALAQQL